MIRPLALLIALAGLAAAPAQACQRAIEPLQLLWPSVPSDLQPDEVVLEVTYERRAADPQPISLPPSERDVVVLWGCGGGYYLFRVARVLAGRLEAEDVLLGGNFSEVDTPGGPRIIIGRMTPWRPDEKANGEPVLYDPRETFVPRLPPPPPQ
jgi:hypothetical protein